MARSLKKGPYIYYKLEKKVLANVASNKKTVKIIGNYMFNKGVLVDDTLTAADAYKMRDIPSEITPWLNK